MSKVASVGASVSKRELKLVVVVERVDSGDVSQARCSAGDKASC